MQEEISGPILILSIFVFCFFMWWLCGSEKRKINKAIARGCVAKAYVVEREYKLRRIMPQNYWQEHDRWIIKYQYQVKGKKYYIKRTHHAEERYVKENFNVYYNKFWPRLYVVEKPNYDRRVLGCLGSFILTAITVNIIYYILKSVLGIMI